MSESLRIATKELAGFFASPVAYIFIGAFLAAVLFTFFWVDTFFARNIADVRPLFDWMPLLLIFLVAALSMRLWSEERRSGTLETLMTLPVSTWQLVLGKLLAVMGLIALALALTLTLPLMVSSLGPMDWGPVWGSYLATGLLALAYAAIGLFVSSRTDNAIVALIGTVLICGLLYLVGSPTLTQLAGYRVGEILALIGTGSRFESITRGVIDLRDLYYYLSIAAVFLLLNVYSLERLRWPTHGERRAAHQRWGLAVALAAANLLAVNLWLTQIGGVRADLTEGRIYSISDATRTYLAQLDEPMLIRGYFSAQTHPLLAPLVPQMRDLLREIEIAGDGRVRVEIIDPANEPELEREAGEKYGIRPVAFQTASKYQAAVVNSYFDLLVVYGDQYEKLGFRDLIDIKAKNETDIDVRLRNPEYDIARTIKKVLFGYRGGGDVFSALKRPVRLTGYISGPERLPEALQIVETDLKSVLQELSNDSAGKLITEFVDPDAGDGAVAREIEQRFGFQPLALGLLDPTTFWFYLVMESGDQVVPVPLPEELDRAGLKRGLEAALKRFAPGFLKSVALYTPTPAAPNMMMQQAGASFEELRAALSESVDLRDTDLSTGLVPDGANMLLVVGPETLDDKQVFAIDQYLMQGGTVVIAASPFHVDFSGRSIMARPQRTGLEDWLQHQGLTLPELLVMDPVNTPFPIPVQRDLGGFTVEEIRTLAYPYFPDIRGDGLNQDNGITASLGQITLNWASPIEIDAEANAERTVTRLLKSSPEAWTSDSADIQPDFDRYGELGFPIGEERAAATLAVMVEGRFSSPFAGQPSPLLAEDEAEAGADEETPPDIPGQEAADEQPDAPRPSGVVETSPASARLILIGSSSFLTDTAISLATEATRTFYTKPAELMQNAVDWSLEDRGLLQLRGRSQFSRLLDPLAPGAQGRIEMLIYLLALAGLVVIWWLYRRTRARRERHYHELLQLRTGSAVEEA